MTDQPNTHPNEPCRQTAGMAPHPPHKFMRSRTVYQCPGDSTPAIPAADAAQLQAQLAEARQHAAAIAAQRDRLRQRMNTLADRWDHALPVDKPYARTLRAEISVDPFDPDGAMTVQEYTERGRRLWVFRCWGTEACDGWLGLGHHTQTSALLERERHVAEAHAAPGPAATQATDSTAARTARIRSLTLPASGRQLDPHLSRRLPGILHLGHRPTSLDMALIAEAADVSVDWLLYGDAATPEPDPAGLREQPAPTVDRQTAAVLAALHRSAEADVTRVIDLYERWVKAGPPLGKSMTGYFQWWHEHLAELHAAILNPTKEQP
jgi:hypothetical protein